MNFLTIAPELEQLITTLLAENKCACHIINPHKTRILMWKEVKVDQTTYHLRIGIQRFIAQEQVDRNGEIYWRYLTVDQKEAETKSTISPVKAANSSQEEAKSEVPTPSDPITKFQSRQAKTQQLTNHEESKSELAPNH